MEAKDTALTPEEIKQGCSAYIDHGGGVGFYCRLKPTLKRNGRIYCTRHDPVKLKTISDKRRDKYIKDLDRAEQSRKNYTERLKQEGIQIGMQKVVDFIDGCYSFLIRPADGIQYWDTWIPREKWQAFLKENGLEG